MAAQEILRDRLLIRRAIGGNQEAFQLLLDFYWKHIKSIFLQKKLSEEEAEDLTLLTFSKAFSKIKQYKPTYAFSTWLYQIANNNFIDHLRKQKRRVVVQSYSTEVQDDVYFASTEAEFSPEVTFICKERKRSVRELLKKMKPPYYQLIVMRFLEEKSYEEIAKELNLPMGTVKAKLFRAKRQMTKIFRAHKRLFNA